MKVQNAVVNQFIEDFTAYLPNLAMGGLVLIFGLVLSSYFTRIFVKYLVRKALDPSLHAFLGSLVNVVLKIAVFISVLSIWGVKTSSFVAVLGSMGLAIGLALQGSLSHLAGGTLLIARKPFAVGDFIETQGISGTVQEITLFSTTLKTPDNKVVFVPNGPLSNGVITNVTREAERRFEIRVGVAYDSDLDEAKTVLMEALQADPRVLTDPAPKVLVGLLGDSSVEIILRGWAKKEEFWDVHHAMVASVKVALDKKGISIPFPQREIRLLKDD